MTKNIQMMAKKLETLREFQAAYPKSHVGGSIGLMILGIDLKRELYWSDLDITVDEFTFNKDEFEDVSERSDANDFDYGLKKEFGNGFYQKLDIRIDPAQSFDVINFDGYDYNVSTLDTILYWKDSYSNKGVDKHADDLETIKTGDRPQPKQQEADFNFLYGDLPF